VETPVELAVFREFAQVAPFTIALDTISRGVPPEPDIVCEIPGEGLLGFELTELIDARFMSRLDLMAKTNRALRAHWQALPQRDHDCFNAKYSDALLHFQFGPDIGYTKRSASLPSVFAELLSLPDGYTGHALRLDKRFLPILRGVIIRRGSFVGPAMDADSFGWLSDPTNDTLSKKLAKTYDGAYPVELLAYVDWDLLPPEGAWKAAADKATGNLESSQIRRVWIFNRGKREVIYVHPPRDSAF
jgi:hypothetical protein